MENKNKIDNYEQWRTNQIDESWKDTSWENGFGDKVSLEEILEITKDIEVVEIETKSLRNNVLDWDGNEKEIEKSDLKYPPLILVNDDESIKYILDGNHRIQKALSNDIEKIKVKLIIFSDLPSNIQKILK